jgi:subtilisin family serine protease
VRSLRLLLVLAILPLLLPACGQIELPPFDPDNPCWPFPPGSCTPTPTEPWDCANPPAMTGKVVFVPNPLKDQWSVVLKRRPVQRTAAAFGTFAQGVASRYAGLKNVKVNGIGFAATASHQLVLELLRDADVDFVEQVGTKRINASSWGLDRVDQRDLPLDGFYSPLQSGQGVHVAIIDTGIYSPHKDFEGRLGECNSTIVFGGCEDQHDHGTHVAGTVGGTEFGIAKKVTLHADRFLDANGSGSDTDGVAAIEWFTNLCTANGWNCVANSSWGGAPSASIATAMCQSIEAGVTHVVAAGNDGGDACASSPSNVKQTITVGATSNNDSATSWSNHGQCVDLYAPGDSITSAKRGGGSTVMSGTSMASPHVAGAAALCVEKLGGKPSPAEVKACVLSLATPDKVKGAQDSPNLLLFVEPVS